MWFKESKSLHKQTLLENNLSKKFDYLAVAHNYKFWPAVNCVRTNPVFCIIFAIYHLICWYSDLLALIGACYFFLWHECDTVVDVLQPYHLLFRVFSIFFFLVFFFYFFLAFLSLLCLTSSISAGYSWCFLFSLSLFWHIQRKCCALPKAYVCGRNTGAVLETEFVCGCTRNSALGVCICFFC